MATLCFAYQDTGYHAQVDKHLKILKDHSAGRPGARMENSQRHMVVKVKIALLEGKAHLVAKHSNLASQSLLKAEKLMPKEGPEIKRVHQIRH